MFSRALPILLLLLGFAFSWESAAQLTVPAEARRIGIYTGTFDPPHAGHLRAIQAALADLNLDVIYVIPNTTPTHKPEATSYALRREMSQLAFGGDSRVVVADAGIERLMQSDGIDGVLRSVLAESHPSARITRVLGDDTFAYYLNNPAAVTHERLDLAVARRGSRDEFPERVGRSRVVSLNSVEEGYSSTLARQALARGERPSFVAPRVMELIQRSGLYGPMPTCLGRLLQVHTQ